MRPFLRLPGHGLSSRSQPPRRREVPHVDGRFFPLRTSKQTCPFPPKSDGAEVKTSGNDKARVRTLTGRDFSACLRASISPRVAASVTSRSSWRTSRCHFSPIRSTDKLARPSVAHSKGKLPLVL